MKFFVLMFLLSSLLMSKEKIALLIGNSEYPFQPLSNPINDVNAIKKSLLQIGFEKNNIVVLKNVSQQQMKKSLFQFEQQASQAEIALIYFSGHGIQVDNTNYLFPANTTAKKQSDLASLIKLESLIDSTTSAKFGVLLIDACRTNPLVKKFKYEDKQGDSGTKDQGKKGLGQVNTQQSRGEFIIGFATSAGNTADDGQYSSTSPYVEALTRNLQLNLEIRKVLGKVGKEVREKYPHQNPIVRSTLGKSDVCLTGTCEESSNRIIIKGDLKGGLNLGSGNITNNY